MQTKELKSIEKKITGILDNCPCCKSNGICKFIGYSIESPRFYVGCSNDKCRVHVSEFSCDVSYDKQWNGQYAIVETRTPEEMAKIWNKRN